MSQLSYLTSCWTKLTGGRYYRQLTKVLYTAMWSSYFIQSADKLSAFSAGKYQNVMSLKHVLGGIFLYILLYYASNIAS